MLSTSFPAAVSGREHPDDTIIRYADGSAATIDEVLIWWKKLTGRTLIAERDSEGKVRTVHAYTPDTEREAC